MFTKSSKACNNLSTEVTKEFVCRRHDLTNSFKNMQCKTLIFVGESSPFHAEAVYMSAKLDRRNCALVEVGCCALFCLFLSHRVLS